MILRWLQEKKKSFISIKKIVFWGGEKRVIWPKNKLKLIEIGFFSKILALFGKVLLLLPMEPYWKVT